MKFKEFNYATLVGNAKKYLRKSFFRKQFNNAPSDICRLYMAIIYCRSYEAFSKNSNRDSLLEKECYFLESKVEEILDIKDWEYMRDHFAGSIHAKIMYSDIIKKIKMQKRGKSVVIKKQGREIVNPYFNG